MNRKIIVGLSGGVDSSISLLLLKKSGWQPIGVSLKLPIWQERAKPIRNQPSVAQKVCRKLEVPLYQIDARDDFKKQVVDYFTNELKNNRRPNPCVVCNVKFKFKNLWDFAKKNKISYIATGHYARIKSYQLLTAKDKNKDQSYYLSFLKQEWLRKIIFPLGEYTKDEVYKIAKKEGFDYWDKKKQSQDFCYLGGRTIKQFIKKEIKTKLGVIVDDKGNKIGGHKGLQYYTIGQRKGIKLSGGPYYVKGFENQKNELVVTKNKEKIYKKIIKLAPFNIISGCLPVKPVKVMAKVRYRQSLKPAVLQLITNNNLKIIFKQPQLAVTPGQVCVFYKGRVCLGGGVIN